MKTPIQKQMHALTVGLRRLERAAGVVSHRNARTATVKALRELRRAVDATHPPKRRAPKRRRKRRTGVQLARHLERTGWAAVSPVEEMVPYIAQAGIRVRSVKQSAGAFHSYVPNWAVDIYRATKRSSCVAVLKRARKSPRERRALLTEIELTGGLK